MHVYLLRHGVAEDAGPGVSDRDRALTGEGTKRLQRAVPAWRRLLKAPQIVFVSPLRRAQQTAEFLLAAGDRDAEVRTEPVLVPEADPMQALHLLQAEQWAGAKSVACVGHEPHLGYLLGLLLTGQPRTALPMKKGMLAAVETPSAASMIGELRFVLSTRAAADLVADR
jgi:phosphohistidine phosphatase